MPFTSKASASEVVAVPGYEGHLETLEGWTVAFETYTEDTDLTPYFRGLPDDACQANHHGYVVKGRLVWHYTDGTTEVTEAGHAYVTRPGHTPELFAGTEVVEFTRADELAETMAVVSANFAAGPGAG